MDRVKAAVTGCDCHEWHDVREIGDWRVAHPGSGSVSNWASAADIWESGRCALSREDLTGRIRTAGGISCEHALQAMMRLSGEIELSNGVHRWAVAADLGIRAVPVRMTAETEPVWAAW